jgi:hypothetical protein
VDLYREATLRPLRESATLARRRQGHPAAGSRATATATTVRRLPHRSSASQRAWHAVSLLDALALERAVDAGWTFARRPATPHGATVFRPRKSASLLVGASQSS